MIIKYDTINPTYGYNMQSGGTSGFKVSEETIQKSKTRIVTEETRRKLSEAGKGRIFSEESKRKISESQKGKIIPEEAKKKLSEARKGKRHSEETKAKMSKSQRGKKGKPVAQITDDKIIIYPSTGEAGRQTNTSQAHISDVCRHNPKRHKAGGYVWRFASEITEEDTLNKKIIYKSVV